VKKHTFIDFKDRNKILEAIKRERSSSKRRAMADRHKEETSQYETIPLDNSAPTKDIVVHSQNFLNLNVLGT
jgi:hypothetical protein